MVLSNSERAKLYRQKKKDEAEDLKRQLVALQAEEVKRKESSALASRKYRAKKKRATATAAEMNTTTPSESSGRPPTPVNERTPLPVQSPPPYIMRTPRSVALAPTTPQPPTLPASMENATPQEQIVYLSTLSDIVEKQSLTFVAQANQHVMAEVREVAQQVLAENRVVAYRMSAPRTSPAPPRSLMATMEEPQAEESPQIEASRPVVTPDLVFHRDGWKAESPEQFQSLCALWYRTLTSIEDPTEAIKLLLRFLAFAIVEYEQYYELVFGSDPEVMQYVPHFIAEFVRRNWITDGEDKSLGVITSFMKEQYVPAFKVGATVDYRKLDDQGHFMELVPAKIVKVHDGIFGSCTIKCDGKEKDTLVHRMELPGRIE